MQPLLNALLTAEYIILKDFGQHNSICFVFLNDNEEMVTMHISRYCVMCKKINASE